MRVRDAAGGEGNGLLRVRQATEAELAQWDRWARSFPGCRVVHKRAWLESLAASHYGRVLYLVFDLHGQVAGCWPGVLARRGPFRVFGSPPPGSQTASMGPVFDPDRLSTLDVVRHGVRLLERTFGVHYVELISACLDGPSMKDLGFQSRPVRTYRVRLQPGREDEVFRRFKGNARRNIRRADRLGLRVRFEDNESFVDEAFDQIREVFARRGLKVPFTKQRVLAFFRCMKAAGNLIAVSVHLPDGGPTVATGTFTVEGRELLLWQWAHRTQYRWYRPTELMTWEVMKKAMAAGCETFDMMGLGDFKTKFGVQIDGSLTRWMRGRFRWIQRARELAEKCYRWQQSVRARAADRGPLCP